MKIKVLQENLNTSLQHLQKAIPSKPQLPILSSILIEIKNNQCTLSATDLYFAVRCTVQVDSEDSATFVVPGKQFKEIISSLNPGVLTVTYENTALTITSDKTKTTLSCLSSDDFPKFPQIEGSEFTLPFKHLEMIEKNIIFSASVDQARPVLTAILFEFSPEGLQVVSTDGFRLSTLVLDSSQSFEPETFLIPAKALSEVFRIASKLEVSQVRFIVSQELKQVIFYIEDVEVFVRLIEGAFPPYQKIIPLEFNTEVMFDSEELIEHLRRAHIFAKESSNIVKFVITDELVTITSSSPTYGTYIGELKSVSVSGKQNEIAFNIKYLLDYLSTTKETKHWFGMNESLKPALFKPESLQLLQYVVMPFKINS